MKILKTDYKNIVIFISKESITNLINPKQKSLAKNNTYHWILPPFLFSNQAQIESLSRFKTKKAPFSGSIFYQ
jgi:beta-lactamase class D